MDLLNQFLPRSDFSSYDDFCKGFELNFPDDFNFAYDVVDFYAVHSPEQRALVWCNDLGQSKEFTFKQISDLSFIAAAFLKEQGIGPKDVVILSLHRHYEYWIFLLALHRLGAVAFPLSSQLTQDEVLSRKEYCKAKLVITFKYLNEKWQAYYKSHSSCLPQISRPKLMLTDPMLLYFTSGTQGEAKAVLHNWLYPLAHIITAKYWQKNLEGGLHYTMAETGWAKASWGKIYGQWICGSAVFVYDRKSFNPQSILQKICDYKVTTFCAPPVIYRYLIELDFSKYDLSALTHCCSAGEALDPHLAQAFFEKTGLHIYEGYGQTETALLCANFDFKDTEIKPGSFGRPSPLYKLSLNKNEIVLALSNNLIPGLFTNYPDSAVTQGFYQTGDLAQTDAQGYFYFTGRKDAIIKSAGFRISPFEVENVLNRHKAVLEAYVYGRTDFKRGQIVVASVILRKGFSPDKKMEQQLLDYLRENLALYKCPRKIEFVKSLPKTYNGKIKRGGHNKSEEDSI